MSLIPCGEHALNDDLVGAPVPDAKNRSAEKNARPGIVGIADRFDHVEIAGGNRGAKTGKAADFLESDKSQSTSTGQENDRLHEVCVNDRGETSGNRIDTGGDDKNNCCRPRILPAHDAIHDKSCCIEVHGNLREDIRNDGNTREIRGAVAVKTALQKFRHGENIRPKIEGNEYPSKEKKNENGEPFIVTGCEAGGGAGTGEADEMLRGNVRNEQRSADGEPADVAAREEIAFGRALFP